MTPHTVTGNLPDPADDGRINVAVAFTYFPPERGQAPTVWLDDFKQIDGQTDIGRDDVEEWLYGPGFFDACEVARRERHGEDE